MQHQYLGVKNHLKKFDNNSHKYKHPSHSLDPLISVHLLVKKKSVLSDMDQAQMCTYYSAFGQK